MRILIAEDDLVSRNFLNKFLSKYGDCDLVVDGLETLDAFLMAIKDKAPYGLICLDIMMPKADGIKTLKAVRDLEKQYGILEEKRVKIIMTTALAETQHVRTSFDYGCEAYATKPIDIKKMESLLAKLGFKPSGEKKTDETEINEKIVFTSECGKKNSSSNPTIAVREGYFKNVKALTGYHLKVVMETGTSIHFDFRSRLNTARFGRLKDEELFKSVRTDGSYLIFEKAGKMTLKITAAEFMDLVLVDRRKQGI